MLQLARMLTRSPLNLMAWLGLAGSVLMSGCASLPEQRGDEVEVLVDRLVEFSPVDIAVLPVENLTPRTSLPLDILRQEFHAGLVRRRYSPLALEFVDSQVVNASYWPGMLEEGAALMIKLTQWDDSRWVTRSRLTLAAEVSLLDASGVAEGRELWAGRITKTVSVDGDRTAVSDEARLVEIALERFANEILGALPQRDPVSARSLR